MQYQIPRYLNEQVRFVGLQSDEFCGAIYILLRNLSLSMDSSIFEPIDGCCIHLVEPQFSQRFCPAFSIFQRIL